MSRAATVSQLRLPHFVCGCGATTGNEASFERALASFMAHACPAPGLCAICAGDTEPVIRQRVDEREVNVCRRCAFEHPIGGGYDFNGGRPDPRSRGASAAHSTRKAGMS